MRWLRDWWRGYSDADMESFDRKVSGPAPFPGAVIELTKREYRAVPHYYQWLAETDPIRYMTLMR